MIQNAHTVFLYYENKLCSSRSNTKLWLVGYIFLEILLTIWRYQFKIELKMNVFFYFYTYLHYTETTETKTAIQHIFILNMGSEKVGQYLSLVVAQQLCSSGPIHIHQLGCVKSKSSTLILTLSTKILPYSCC